MTPGNTIDLAGLACDRAHGTAVQVGIPAKVASPNR
jgi:hypothetical protein